MTSPFTRAKMLSAISPMGLFCELAAAGTTSSPDAAACRPDELGAEFVADAGGDSFFSTRNRSRRPERKPPSVAAQPMTDQHSTRLILARVTDTSGEAPVRTGSERSPRTGGEW